MKTLDNLTNSEKAKFVFSLFPNEIPSFIEHLKSTCQYLRENEQSIRSNWANGFFTDSFWFALVADVERLLSRHRHALLNSINVLADQLFYGTTAVFTIDCLVKFAEQNTGNSKFREAVNTFFT